MQDLIDKNIKGYKELITPYDLKDQLPVTDGTVSTVLNTRQSIEDILSGKDNRRDKEGEKDGKLKLNLRLQNVENITFQFKQS